jgi:hypothetical protein
VCFDPGFAQLGKCDVCRDVGIKSTDAVEGHS